MKKRKDKDLEHYMSLNYTFTVDQYEEDGELRFGLEIPELKGVWAHGATIDEAYTDLIPFLRQLRQEGYSYQKIADRMNSVGHTTRRGKSWSPMQVSNVLKQF